MNTGEIQKPARPRAKLSLHAFSPGAILASLAPFYAPAPPPVKRVSETKTVPVFVAGPGGAVVGHFHEIEPSAQKYREHKFAQEKRTS